MSAPSSLDYPWSAYVDLLGTVRAVAADLQVKPSTIYKWIKKRPRPMIVDAVNAKARARGLPPMFPKE